jgi:hypothetical protein
MGYGLASSEARMHILDFLHNKIMTTFCIEVRADAICSAAARRPLFIGGGGARFSATRRRRRGVLRLLTQFHTFCSVYFYSLPV